MPSIYIYMWSCVSVCVCVSPLLSQKSDVEFVSLQLFAGVCHHLVKGSLQQVFSPDQQPTTTQTVHTSHWNCLHAVPQPGT